MDPHFYLGALSEEIAMSSTERAAALAQASELEVSLKRMLPHIRQLRPFGSVVRRTALAAKIDAAVDLDCLICTELAAAQHRFPKTPFDAAEQLMVDELCAAVKSIVSPATVTLRHQWITFENRGIRFELSIGRRNDSWPENQYLMYIRDSAWGRLHPKLWSRYVGNTIKGIRKDGSEDPDVLVAAEPFALDYSWRNEWEQTLTTGVILILKYWNGLYRERIPSFVLESNVAKWLDSEQPKGRPRSLFELTSTFLRNRVNFDNQLFRPLRSFQMLRKAFRTAEELIGRGREQDAVGCLTQLLPWPDRLQSFELDLK